MTEPSFLLADPQTSAWLDAVVVRRSRRAFDPEPVSAEVLDALELCCTSFRPYPDARVELVRTPKTDIFRGAVGSYGKVVGASHVLLIIADDSAPHSQQHAGYTGEAVVLDATARGLDTCWVGGFFSRRATEGMVGLKASERIVAVSPVGHARTERTLSERLMTGMAGSHARKPLEEIAPGSSDGWPEWARAAVECARLAPSAVNRQPWRFGLDSGSLVVLATPGAELPKVTKALDCGIAMLHAQLGALGAGVSGQWHDESGGGTLGRFVPDLGSPT